MSIYKRGNVYWARFTTPDGQRIRQSCETSNRSEAQEYHDRLKAEYWRVQKVGGTPIVSWEQAVVRWLKEQTHKKTLYNDKSHIRRLEPFLLGKNLNEITRDVVDSFVANRKNEGVKNATINRSLEVLRAILRRAENDWGWLDKAPIIRMLQQPKRRIRWLTPAEAQSLLDNLPEHTKAMAQFTLATGLRESNVTGLQWSQIDMQRKTAWIHDDQAKGGKGIAVPLNADAIEVLKQQIGKHTKWVFTFRGKRILKASTRAWRLALKRVGIDDFRWHDLRHTWASWHVQNGTPLHVLQELGGWESYEMVRRYAHLSSKHLSDYASNVSFTGTNLAQLEKSRKSKQR